MGFLLGLFVFNQVWAQQDLLLMVDPTCWSHQSAAQVRAAQTHGFRVQHKSWPAQMRSLAVSVHSDHTVSADDVAVWSQQACVREVHENPRFQIASAPDPLQSQQAALTPISQLDAEQIFFHPLYGIRVPAVVAVVDSGVQLDHPDLVSHIWHSPLGTAGFDFVNGDNDPSDDNGHGTHVAGITGAQRDNGIGIRGVMGDWSQLMAVKTQGADGGGLLADLVNGIHYAADNGADVINLSLSGTTSSDLLEQSIQYAIDKGVVVTAAAGNDGQEITAQNLVYPASYSLAHPGMMTVGAFDAQDFSRPSFSNYSTNYVQIAAPGCAGANGLLSTYKDSRYLALPGTSQATPMVSAAAALTIAFLKTHGQTPTPLQVQNWIQKSAVEDPGLATSFSAGRRLDLKRLGSLLLQSTVIDTSGGFDDP
jgi:thermitase